MIPQTVLDKDIATILNSTKCFYGSYAELHQYDYKGSQSKMDEFLAIAKQHFGKSTEVDLLKAKVIFPNLDGGYDFNFGNATLAGGVTYSERDWHTLFYFDARDFNDYCVVYHELAHAMQIEMRLFNHQIVNDVFNNNLSREDYDKISGKKKYRLQYLKYLTETHADVFGEACVLLRAKNFVERIDFSRRLKARIGNMFINGINDDSRSYPSSRFYTDFRAKLQIIKEVNRWYRSGEIADFIDKNGNINFEKLAIRTKEIVLKYTNSPKTFYDLLMKDSYKKTDVWKAKFFAALNPNWLNYKEVRHIKQTCKKHQRINDNLFNIQFNPLKETDENAAILNTVCALDHAYTKFIRATSELSVDLKKFKYFNSENAVEYGRIPDSVHRLFIGRFFQDYPEEMGNKIFNEYQRGVNYALFDSHADKDTVAKISVAMREDIAARAAIWKMYRKRQENPWAKVSPKDFMQEFPVMSHKYQQKKELGTFIQLKNIIFEGTEDLSATEMYAIRKKVIDFAEQCPKEMENIDVRDIYAAYQGSDIEETIKSKARHIASFVHSVYYLDKKTFNNVMKKYASSLRKINDQTIGKTHVSATKTKNNGKGR